MNHEERTAWVAGLKPGDEVSVYEGWREDRHVYDDIVARVTKGGRVCLEHGTVFRPDGWIYGMRGGVYSDRHIGPRKGC